MLIGVQELVKHPHQRCKHQCEGGCDIHISKPKECRTYQCQWRSDESVPKELRPDKLGCIIDIHNTPLGLAIICHQSEPDQWSKESIIGILSRLAKHNDCWIYAIHGNNRQAIFPEWAIEQQKQFDSMVVADTMQELYGSIAHPDE